MILPDADADTDSKKGRAGPSSLNHPSGTPTHDAPTPPTPEPAPDSEPALDLEPESEPLPPYTPRERDPLLPTSARRRKPTRRARRIRMCTALLLVVSLTSAMTLRLSRPRTSGVSEVCQTADNWAWVDRRASDPHFYIEGGTTLPSNFSDVRLVSVSPGFFGTLEIMTPSDYYYEGIIIIVRAGHHSLDVLRRIRMCRRVFANATVLISVELLEPLPEGRVSLEMSIQLPGPPVSSKSGPRLVPNLTVEVASMNVSCLDDIARSVYFNTLSLATTNGSITMAPVKADRITLSADGHPLTADLHAGASVSLANTDAPIVANISFRREEDPSAPSRLNISSAGAVDASISLSNATASPPELVLGANTSAPAPLDIRIASLPEHALLTAHVSAPAGTAFIALPPAFEGDFRLRAPGDLHLDNRTGAADPSGRGRRRVGWSHSTGRGAIEGRTYWDDANEERRMGFVDVSGASAGLLL